MAAVRCLGKSHLHGYARLEVDHLAVVLLLKDVDNGAVGHLHPVEAKGLHAALAIGRTVGDGEHRAVVEGVGAKGRQVGALLHVVDEVGYLCQLLFRLCDQPVGLFLQLLGRHGIDALTRVGIERDIEERGADDSLEFGHLLVDILFGNLIENPGQLVLLADEVGHVLSDVVDVLTVNACGKVLQVIVQRHVDRHVVWTVERGHPATPLAVEDGGQLHFLAAVHLHLQPDVAHLGSVVLQELDKEGEAGGAGIVVVALHHVVVLEELPVAGVGLVGVGIGIEHGDTLHTVGIGIDGDVGDGRGVDVALFRLAFYAYGMAGQVIALRQRLFKPPAVAGNGGL